MAVGSCSSDYFSHSAAILNHYSAME